MQLLKITALTGLFCATALASPLAKRDIFDEQDAMKVLKQLNSDAIEALGEASQEGAKCTLENATRRKDWNKLCPSERKEYIKAVQCLQELPAQTRYFAEGARTRYDDFVAVHINQTRVIHGTGNFLTWHRYFVWLWEKALHDECGYKGAQPYWNWFEHADDLTKSPVFDGSDTSLGGDGEYFEHNGTLAGRPGQNIFLPSGAGGGCVKSGPFVNLTLNLGPIQPAMQGHPSIAPSLYAHNPRCQRRDLTSYATANWMTAANLLNLTLGDASASIGPFQDELQGRGQDGFLGMHSSGHFASGGDASCFYTSTNDPVFWLHHAMVDNVYWLWQTLHPEVAGEVAGTITLGNIPPSRDAELDDLLEMLVLGDDITIKDAMDTMGGKFCYIYV